MKYFVVVSAMALLFMFPEGAAALSISELSAKLEEIKTQIAVLLEQVRTIESELRQINTSIPPTSSAAIGASGAVSGVPDLAVTDIRFSPEKDQYRAGDSLEVAVQVKNNGTKESGVYALIYRNRISGDLLAEVEHSSLQPESVRLANYRFSSLSSAVPDINEISVEAVLRDGEDANRSDNKIEKSFFLATPPRSSGGGGGGGGGNAPAITTIEMQPGNDYYFKGPVTLQQLSDAGFVATGYLGNPDSQLLLMPNNPPLSNDSASEVYTIWDISLRSDSYVLPQGWSDGWIKTGAGPHGVSGDTLTSAYFIIRKNNDHTPSKFTVPSGITYFGTTPMNDSPRPW